MDDKKEIDSLFLKQPPRVMGLDTYFRGDITKSGNKFVTEFKEFNKNQAVSQKQFTQFQHDTLMVLDSIRKEVTAIKESQLKEIKQQNLAEVYRRQKESAEKKKRTAADDILSILQDVQKQLSRGLKQTGSGIISGLLDTLLPGLGRMGLSRLLGKLGGGLLAFLFGGEIIRKVLGGVGSLFRNLGGIIGRNISSLFRNIKSSITKNLKDLFKDIKGKGGTTSTTKGSPINGTVIPPTGRAKTTTPKILPKTASPKLLSTSTSKLNLPVGDVIDIPSSSVRTVSSTTVSRTAGSTLGSSLAKSPKFTGNVVKGLINVFKTTIPRMLLTVGTGLLGTLSNPWVIGAIVAGIVGWVGYKLYQKFKNGSDFTSKSMTSDEYIKNKAQKGSKVKPSNVIDLSDRKPTRVDLLPAAGSKGFVRLADLGLRGSISRDNSIPEVATRSARGVKVLDTQLSDWGYNVVYTSARGGHAYGTGHAKGNKVDLQLWKGGKPTRLTPAQEQALLQQGYFGGKTGALGWEAKQGQVGGGHYDFFVALNTLTLAVNKTKESFANLNRTIKAGTITGKVSGTNTVEIKDLSKLNTKLGLDNYQGIKGIGHSIYQTSDEVLTAGGKLSKQERRLTTQVMQPNQYSTPPVSVQTDKYGNSYLQTPDGDIGMLEFLHVLGQQ